MTARAIPIADLKAIARSDDPRRLAELLSDGFDLERTDEAFRTPLAVVAKEGALQCVRLLVEHGAFLDAGDKSPVQATIESNKLKVLEELLRLGAESGGPEDYNPDYPAPLVVAAEIGNVGAVEVLLAYDSLGRSPWAVIDDALRQGLGLRGKKKLDVLRALAFGLVRNDGEIPVASGPLLRALKYLARVAQKNGDGLLESGVRDLKASINKAKAELDEVEDACLESRYDELFELLKHLPAARRPGVLGVVAASSTTGCYSFAQWLLEKGAAANICDETGKTALMHVAAHGSEHLIQPLLDRGDACLQAKDGTGKTALDLLGLRATFPFAHVIEGDLTNLYNIRRDRETPPVRVDGTPRVVQRAREHMRNRRMPELLELLKANRLDKESWQLAAGAAVLEDCANSCMTLLEYCIDQGADLNTRKDRGSHALHGACEVHQTPLYLLRRMIKAGADPTVVDRFGRSVADNARRTWPEDHECRIYMESVFAANGGE